MTQLLSGTNSKLIMIKSKLSTLSKLDWVCIIINGRWIYFRWSMNRNAVVCFLETLGDKQETKQLPDEAPKRNKWLTDKPTIMSNSTNRTHLFAVLGRRTFLWKWSFWRDLSVHAKKQSELIYSAKLILWSQLCFEVVLLCATRRIKKLFFFFFNRRFKGKMSHPT